MSYDSAPIVGPVAEAIPTASISPDAPPLQVTPTQVRRPWRATVRTVFQALVALATLLPFIVSGVYQDSTAYPAVVVQVLAVSGALSRVMALPQVEAFLRLFLPFLSAAPNPPEETRHG